MRNRKKLGVGLIIGGAVLLLIGIVMIAAVRHACRDLGFFGRDMSVEGLKDMIDWAEGAADLFGTSLADVIGESVFKLFLLKASVALRLVLTVLGSLMMAAGIVLVVLSGSGSSAGAFDHVIIGPERKNPCSCCGTDNPVDGKFCVFCGLPLSGRAVPETPVKKCACGADNPVDGKFCVVCGRPLGGEILPPVTPVKKCACGADNPVDGMFCVVCGRPLGGEILPPVTPPVMPVKKCACGADNPVDGKFCVVCGKPLHGPVPGEKPDERPGMGPGSGWSPAGDL